MDSAAIAIVDCEAPPVGGGGPRMVGKLYFGLPLAGAPLGGTALPACLPACHLSFAGFFVLQMTLTFAPGEALGLTSMGSVTWFLSMLLPSSLTWS